ncbi:MAG: 2-C-methyl-D-erythritol 2,4-cyclodiphosphate synthase [Desulfobacterales bacterium]|nr:2-C-methyl-D-erythritol 2,4-cyclodiphosphate synthase [Desulfobacterales bacterium]
MRIGMGYDVHRLEKGRRLVIGGVEIPFDKGLMGHSDADVLLHAVCDALLGAAGLGDIGMHYPDTDPAYKDIDSMKLLKDTCNKVSEKGLSVVNLDATVFAEKPKISPYREDMKCCISVAVGIKADDVNIKATTTEGLGMIGMGEGIGAMCVALLKPKP